jgi:hypothetical protein
MATNDQTFPQYRDSVEKAARRANDTYSRIANMPTEIALRETMKLATGSAEEIAIPVETDGMAQTCVLIVNDHLQWLLGMIGRSRDRMERIKMEARNE